MGRTLTYDTPDSSPTYTVRDRITRIYLTVDGPEAGDGGSSSIDDGGPGASGGRIVAYLDVSSGEMVPLYLGDAGTDGEDAPTDAIGEGGPGGPSPLTDGQDGDDGVAAQDDFGGGGGGGGGESGADAPNGDQLRSGGGGGGSGGAGDASGGAGGDGGGPGGAGASENQAGDGSAGSPGSTSAAGGWTVESQTDGGSQHATGWIELVEGGPDTCSVTIDAATTTTVTLALSSSSDATGYYIYRSQTSGFDPTPSNRIADVSRSGGSQTYEDTGRTEGTRYFYAVEAYNAEGVTEDRADATTVLPAATNVQVTNADASGNLPEDQADLTWVDNATDEVAYRVLLTRDAPTAGSRTFVNDSGDSMPGSTTTNNDLAPDTESYTTTNLLDGEQYWPVIEVVGNDTTARTPDTS